MDMNELFLSHHNVGTGVYPQLHDAGDGDNLGGNSAVINNDKEAVANEVDSFLDEFLLLAGDAEGEFDGKDEDLAWLEDPDVFLPESAGLELRGMDTGEGPSQGHAVVAENADGHEENSTGSDGAMAAVQNIPSVGLTPSDPPEEQASLSSQEQLRRLKVARYLEKKKRRQWSRTAPYKSRQVVANSRPRHKGRFLPLESEFVPIAELQRRQRASFKQQQEQQGVT